MNICNSSLISVRRYTPLLIFTAFLSFLLILEAIFRPSAIGGVYFQRWTSEDMMQTLPLIDLRDQPVDSLANLHIQPPALDILRALIVQRYRTAEGLVLLRSVDQDLYRLWAVFFALMGALVFHWLSRLTSFSWALAAALIFMLHPAAILYATFLENTFLFSLGILWCYYELWKVSKQPAEQSILPLASAFILIFMTRSVIQWPALLVFTASLLLLMVPNRKVLVFSALCGAVVGFYSLRQAALFGIPYTSSLAGGNCFHGLGDFSTYEGYGVDKIILEPPLSDASVLLRERKLTGAINFNHHRYLQYHRAMLGKCYQRILTQPAGETILAFMGNFLIFMQPSSQFTTPHIIADRLPWRGIYNAVFSNLVLLLLFFLSVGIWIKTTGKERYRRMLGMLLPAVFIFLMTILFERGENMRYKFFLEPVFFIFLVSQLYSASQYFLFRSSKPSWSTTIS